MLQGRNDRGTTLFTVHGTVSLRAHFRPFALITERAGASY